MANVEILSRPKIDLEFFFKASNKVLGRTVTKAIDRTMIPQTESAKFISALAEFDDENLKSDKATYNVQTAEHELFFLHYVLICIADEETYIKTREWTKLDVTSQRCFDSEIIFLLGGCLHEWKRATRECCSIEAPFHLRLLFDKIILLFEKEGLGNVWFDLRKKTLPDQTFLLEDMR